MSLLVAVGGGDVRGGVLEQSTSDQGIWSQGIWSQGIWSQGIWSQGIWSQGIWSQGIWSQGIWSQGIWSQGIWSQGISWDGIGSQSIHSTSAQQVGVDRGRSFPPEGVFLGIARANVQLPGRDLQGLQTSPPAPITYQSVSSPMAGVRLQAGPTESLADRRPGTFIYVPGVPDLKGTFWNIVLADRCDADAQCTAPSTCDTTKHACLQPCTDDSQCGSAKCVLGSCSSREAAVALYIADVEKDTEQNSSVAPSNDDVWLYTVYYREPATGRWASLCPTDSSGKARAMAVPMDLKDWTGDVSRTKLAFACTASGVAAKCARNWGYKPWEVTGPDHFYESCLVAARADYCQDDTSYTRNGTPVDLFDSIPTPGALTSVNGSVGFSVNPFDGKPMLHPEYQVSINGRVGDVFALSEIDDDVEARVQNIEQLRLSLLTSSRYPDLDPGRSCFAAPYVIGRCDPPDPSNSSAPSSCPRDSDRIGLPPGTPWMSVSSAFHCDHRENEPGAFMNPMCSSCTARICSVEPTCCGFAGGDIFHGGFVWDSRCTTLYDQLCRTTAVGTGAGANVWPPGQLAKDLIGPGGGDLLHGAIGAFAGIVVDPDGSRYAEGWACDPDFPSAPSPVQIVYGAALGEEGSVLLPAAMADGPLAPSWREIVSAECGGGERHGFRVPLPAVVGTQQVWAYGIDLNVPGAPFALLRGGKKIPPGPTLPRARAAIFSGWIEPPVSAQYLFNVDAGPNDKFRLWVNGIFVAGNWKDPVGTPGAFTLDPPSPPPTPFLQQGIRYGIRVEYLRPDTLTTSGTSRLAVTWARPNGPAPTAPAVIPTSALYPIAQSRGNGLQGTYFPGLTSLAALPPPGNNAGARSERTFGAVDYLWSDRNAPISGSTEIPGMTVRDSFAARFEGQFVPPVSGTYRFSLESDGDARVVVNGNEVATAKRRPDAGENLCSHDVCVAGAAISDTCPQSNFCAADVCAVDPACCTDAWDSRCVTEVAVQCSAGATVCQDAPEDVTLMAGWKYDIRVEYQHRGSLPGEPVRRSATLRLLWALNRGSGAREVMPAALQFSAPDEAPQLGTGINVAYFTDAGFQAMYLDKVEPAIAFQAATLPVYTRPGSLICGNPGAPACGAPPALDAPALASAVMGDPASDTSMQVFVDGGGLYPGATLSFFEEKADKTVAALGVTPALSLKGAGVFSARITLSRRTYRLLATQTVNGQTSPLSKPLFVHVRDPLAPPPPAVDPPTINPIGGGASVGVSGFGKPDSSVTVTVTVTGTQTQISSGEFSVGPSGQWAGNLPVLMPGSYDLTIVQIDGDHGSEAAKTVTVKVPVPALTVTAPANNLTVTCPTRTCLVTVSGRDANSAYGPIIVADGADGQFFADLPTQPPQINPATDGTGSFTGQVALDQGRHMLKVFQRVRGQAGEAVPRTVMVRPPTSAFTITEPDSGEVIISKVVVSGAGPQRQGFPGKVRVYQVPGGATACPATALVTASTFLAEGQLADDGKFAIPVTVSGIGRQCLGVSQVQSSLSGAGSVESGIGPVVTVHVRPPAPEITTPVRTGTMQDSRTVTVAGTMVQGASVTIHADQLGVPAFTWAAAVSNGTFVTANTLPAAGTYRLTATAKVDQAESAPSWPVVIAVGDVIPPTVKIANPADPARPVREIPATATSDAGVAVNYETWVTAWDPPSNGGPPTQLLPSQISCQPASGSLFPLGATPVTCTATDGANSGWTTFVVVVEKAENPILIGSNLTAVAQSPAGAPVHYQITSSGFIADCAPPGSPASQSCSAWRPANTGLNVTSSALVRDALSGTLYTTVRGELFRSTNGGGTWQALSAQPGVPSVSRIMVQSGSPPTLIVLPGFRLGLRISRDGGQTWTTSLATTRVAGIAQDPSDEGHLLAWTHENSSPVLLYETRDGGVSWEDADEGLPHNVDIDDVGIDPVNADRMYLSLVGPDPGFLENGPAIKLVRIFRRTDRAAGWFERPIFPYDSVIRGRAFGVMVAPAAGPECDSGGTPFPAVFVGPVYSCDGGNNWLEMSVPTPSRFVGYGYGYGFTNMVFDRSDQDPTNPNPNHLYRGRLYATQGSLLTPIYTSPDWGKTWMPVVAGLDPINLLHKTLVQDPIDGVLYAADEHHGVVRSQDTARTWAAVTASLPAASGVVEGFAADPADPAVAYLARFDAGVSKTVDGGQSWQARNGHMQFVAVTNQTSDVLVHPLARNVVFRGNRHNFLVTPGGQVGLRWGISTDSGATWTDLVDRFGDEFSNDSLAADPFAVGGWLATPANQPGMVTWPGGSAVLPIESGERITKLQMVPDAARTVVASTSSGETAGRTALFSFSSLVTGGPPVLMDLGLTGAVEVFYDSSDGAGRLFVGGKAFGDDESVLFHAKLDELRQGIFNWTRLDGDGVFPAYQRDYVGFIGKVASFKTLLIDPVSGGQTMYTRGSGDTLWESRDGGRNWRRDDTAPGLVSGVWLSPVDGALYATIASSSSSEESPAGVLWKRVANTGVFPGARIVRDAPRVTCLPPLGFTGSITPGSIFPVGDTVLTCSATDVFGNVATQLFTVSVTPQPATNPAPADNATGVSTSASLAWSAGAGATSHDVYFGTTSPGTFRGNRTSTTFNPGTLAANTTYFWRIDERGDGGVTAGTVWRFTTAGAGTIPGAATNPNPANLVTGVATNATLSWTAGSGATSHDVFFGTSNPPASRGNQTATTFTPGPLTANTTYFWRIDERNSAGARTGTVWRFTTGAGGLPGAASNPTPANSATGVGTAPSLTWTAGAGATSHDVYFGTTNPPTARGNRTGTSYAPGTLLRGTRYFWRIDERNASGVRTGPVWSFTTTGALTTLLTDNFEAGTTTNWAPSGGTWAIATDGTKVYRQSNSTGDARSFTTAGASWTDQIVAARIKPTAFNGTDRLVALLGRQQGTTSYYYATLRNSNRIEIKKMVSGAGSTLASKSFTVSVGTWYPVALEITGSSSTSLRLYVDGVLQLSATDSQSPFTTGKAGLQTFNATAVFDDVVVGR